MRNITALGILLSLICGCRFESIPHNPSRAVSEANRFMRALHVERNYQKAFELGHAELHKAAAPDNLRQVVERVSQQAGPLRRLKADSYMQTPGRTMELFYVGAYERGAMYHRVVLMGDADSGYKVSGLWFKADPYPEHRMRHKFNEDIFVE